MRWLSERLALNQAWMPVYYTLGTVVFWVLDVVVSAPIRAAFIGHPRSRYAYYLGLLAIGIVARKWPRSGPVLGIFESATNLTLLVLSIMLPIYGLVDQVESGPLELGFTTWTFVNFAITGAVTVMLLRKHTDSLAGPWSRRVG